MRLLITSQSAGINEYALNKAIEALLQSSKLKKKEILVKLQHAVYYLTSPFRNFTSIIINVSCRNIHAAKLRNALLHYDSKKKPMLFHNFERNQTKKYL